MAIVHIANVSYDITTVTSADKPIGYRVTDTGGTKWVLSESTATVDHTTVEAVGDDPLKRWLKETSGGGTVSSVVAGQQIGVDATDPANPIVNAAPSPFYTRMRTVQSTAGLSALTGTLYFRVGNSSQGINNSLTNLGTIEGGSLAITGGGIFYLALGLLQTPKTASWVMGFRGKLTGPFTGTNSAVAGGFDGGTSNVWGPYLGSVSNTNMTATFRGGGSTTNVTTSVALDTATHDFAYTFDQTTFKFFVDGALAGSSATLTNFPTVPLSVVINATGATMGASEFFAAFTAA